MSSIDEAITMINRGYDQVVTDRPMWRSGPFEDELRRIANALEDVSIESRNTHASRPELIDAAQRTAEQVGRLLALADRGAREGPEHHPTVLMTLALLVGRARKLQEQIDETVLAARNGGASWAQIGKVLGMTKEAAFKQYG